MLHLNLADTLQRCSLYSVPRLLLLSEKIPDQLCVMQRIAVNQFHDKPFFLKGLCFFSFHYIYLFILTFFAS